MFVVDSVHIQLFHFIYVTLTIYVFLLCIDAKLS